MIPSATSTSSAARILCELKRDYHPDLSTAPEQQLEGFYAHDPEAKGFGIYGVLWFGEKRPSPIPKYPNGSNSRLAVIVIDVSGPSA
jgi:hypothetical protein